MAAAPPPGPPAPPELFLSFDCATKTFAFCVCRVALGGVPTLRRRARALRLALERALREKGAAAGATAAAAAAAAEALAADLQGALWVADGETADLAPGRPDAEVHTVERLRAVAAYVARRVRPAVAAARRPGEPLRVLIEYQMGANARARYVAAALVALFADEPDVVFVAPSLKCRVAVCPEGAYHLFAARYATSYGANKAHALFNFAEVERVFGSGAPPCPAAMRGHIADSFMQVLGHLLHGPDDEAPRF